ncbi:MAG: phosphatidate cytidylyltransferase [Bacteroidia bacterium]|nr:phosphatidate cytidylyltransferase [Bacteroidia bacterium]MCF8428335.1 phosphatidate cytidylyltransferase [Bacteroidia bacterium]
MSNFWQRAITGSLFVLSVVGCTLFSEWSFFILLFAINFLCLLEFFELMLPDKNWIEKYLGVIAGSIINIMFAFIIRGDLSHGWFYHLIPVFMLLFIVKLYENTGREFETLAFQILGILYICLPISMLGDFGYFNSLDYSYSLPLGFFILQWSSDTFAYLVGRQFGKHKLFERISPKKTWEGSIGALILTVGIAFLLSRFWDDINTFDWMMVAALIVVFGTFGDLTESLMKRNLNIKDSGTLLPGHGGFLDRFDGVFLSIPAVYFYLLFSN